MEENTTSEGEYLSESDIRKWIGEEMDSRFSGVASKGDIESAISEAFSKFTPSSSSNGEGITLDKISEMIDAKFAKNSGRRPGFLTRALAAK